MSNVLAWVAILLPVLVAAVLTGRLLLLQRREAELGWELAAQKESRAAETEQRIRSEHAAELARTVHDDLGHRLTLASIEAAALRTRAGDDLAPALEQLRASIAGCVEALNRSVTGLGTKDEHAGLAERIDEIAAGIRRAGASVQVEVQTGLNAISESAGPTSSARASAAAVAVVREGCTNVLRHAPGSPIRVRVRREQDDVVVAVENLGADTAADPSVLPTGSGHGLQGLIDQVEEIGGSLGAGPRDDGWLVQARIPSHPTARVDEARRVVSIRRRRTRRMLVVLPLVTAVVMVALPVGAVLGQAALSRISAEDLAAISIGQQEGDARSRLPVMDMQSPPPQVGAGSCHHYEATFSPFERTEVYEVCFTGGQVGSKTIIPAP
ncbi:histidine kinase [Saxibacter everestensis]|uniref:histidine kinase n=1 Tax=Saxibacter everestensis TaxID=2909229 RepID=A0ABY8QZ36_9MICO|nr:histidine kinase [Brevibacteriaceae bacterium ZFBP1038]